MPQVRFIGLDVHKKKIAVAIAEEGRNDEVLRGYALRSRRAAARRKRPRLESDACERWRPVRHSADERDRRSDSQESDTRHYGAVSSGTGKTHIGLGFGLAACQKGLSVGFNTASALVHELLRLATRSGYFACNGNSLDMSS
jgi:hypothetical protein